MLELRSDKVRRKEDWRKWLLPKDALDIDYSSAEEDGASTSENEESWSAQGQGKKKAPKRSSIRKSSVSENGELFEFDEEIEKNKQRGYVSSEAESDDEYATLTVLS